MRTAAWRWAVWRQERQSGGRYSADVCTELLHVPVFSDICDVCIPADKDCVNEEASSFRTVVSRTADPGLKAQYYPEDTFVVYSNETKSLISIHHHILAP